MIVYFIGRFEFRRLAKQVEIVTLSEPDAIRGLFHGQKASSSDQME